VRATVDGAQRWKLVDFGIAVIADAPRATTGNVIVGTPAYMAPEQLTGGAVDARSDLYSLCLVIYRALVGRPAFTADRVGKPTEPPPDPSTSGVPADICDVLRVGLSTRFSSATELEAAFEVAFAKAAEGALATGSARESTP
jgi:serine/threonine-protein kinase